jgi:hydrogenase/urease accessory protein HupE
MKKYQICIISFLVSLLLSLGFSIPTFAHWADLAVAEILVKDLQTEITLTFPTNLVTVADDNRDGKLSDNEVSNHKNELEQFLSERIRLTNEIGENGSLAVALSNTTNLPKNLQTNNNTHSTLALTYTWLKPVSQLNINYNLFVPNVSTARCLATVIHKEKTQNLVFTPEKREFALLENSVWQQISSFLLLGVEHILTGYDHILFLISLLIMGGSLNYLLKIVTAFTVSHSITLSLAVLNIFTLPSQIVESAIPLTIIYVAVENLRRQKVRGRWLLTFAFGLIHGLGFAGILKEINIPHSNLAVSLASFNIGVEIGQIAIVCIAALILRYLYKKPWELTFRRLISYLIIATSFFWFMERAFFSS